MKLPEVIEYNKAIDYGTFDFVLGLTKIWILIFKKTSYIDYFLVPIELILLASRNNTL